MRYCFPKNFLWGAATSAYQVEGGILDNDWADIFPAGTASNHRYLYEDDFSLINQLNLNAYRFSLEWSLIESQNGVYDQKEINRYLNILMCLRKKKIKAMITLHHFTLPKWVAEIGGFANPLTVRYFARFCEKMFYEFGDLVDYWVTINEPMVYAYDIIPTMVKAGNKNKFTNVFSVALVKAQTIIKSGRIMKNLIGAHNLAYQTIKKASQQRAVVGIVKNNCYFEPENQKSFLDMSSVWLHRVGWNEYFLNCVKNNTDFIGLNYYFHRLVRFPFRAANKNLIVTDMGWEVYPEGIYHTIMELKKYHQPIFITENGVADSSDRLRSDFIRDHLLWVYRAIQDGADVRGYYHWSLMDNFEWSYGTDKRFGLVEVNYKTQERRVRLSAYNYAKIAKNNYLEVDT